MTGLPAGSLAGIGPGGELFWLRSDGRGAVSTTILADPESSPPAPLERSPASFVWPVWSPDGSGVLVSTVEYPAAGHPPAQLLRFPTDGNPPIALYRNAERTGLVGPDLPHYINPSPDGRHVALLTQALPGGMALLFVDALGRGPAQAIARGAPLFSAWAPGSDAILVHAGGELSLMELATAPGMQTLAGNHVAYRVPAWSADGKLIAVASPSPGGAALQVIGRDGKHQLALAGSEGIAVFAWSPDGELLAYAEGRTTNPPVYGNLRLLRLDGAVTNVRVPECLAFLWSPDSRFLAALVPDGREGRVSWTIIGRDGKAVRHFPAFRASAELSTYVTFFDQYALSHRLWAPDGSAILGCGRVAFNGTPPELLPSRIYSFDVASGGMQEVAAGSIAFWSAAAG